MSKDKKAQGNPGIGMATDNFDQVEANTTSGSKDL